jgi:hypothetical protein
MQMDEQLFYDVKSFAVMYLVNPPLQRHELGMCNWPVIEDIALS